MVCTRGRERMATMVRVLTNENFPEISSGHEKLAARYIHRELLEADEANLLAEEDMHVFDCKPMTDPLHLVCCNACKKPVKNSQYAAHAERCRSLHSAEETFVELGGGAGHKKPPRKGRKKLLTAPERNSASNNGAVMDGSRVSPLRTNYKAGALASAEKRTKLIVAEHPVTSVGVETACAVATNMGVTCRGELTCEELHRDQIAESEKPWKSVGGCQKLGKALSANVYHPNDFPAPLATKMYNVQRSHRLRNALSHLYHESLANEDCIDSLHRKLVEGTSPLSEGSSPKNFVDELQVDDILQKNAKDAYNSAVQKPDQILAQSSELCLENAGAYQSATNFTNQFRDNNISRPVLSVDTAPIGKMRSRYLSTAYSFPGSSGTSLGTMQQSSGSVPVI